MDFSAVLVADQVWFAGCSRHARDLVNKIAGGFDAGFVGLPLAAEKADCVESVSKLGYT